jgi:WXXGXW repeat (2 copies)
MADSGVPRGLAFEAWDSVKAMLRPYFVAVIGVGFFPSDVSMVGLRREEGSYLMQWAMRRFRTAFPLLVALAAMALASGSSAQMVDVNVAIAPPELPVYDQPEIPGPGYIWTPGFWGYGPQGYYWVPGTWVEPPTVGLLWTPGYWGWRDGFYVWNAGYWGPHIGFYGGVNYGFGYLGSGYEGGYWRDGVFTYNRTVNNFGNVHITNVYDKTVINNTTVTRVSFNGGTGGITARPTSQEQAWAHEQHIPPTTMQTQHVQAASINRSLLASVNHGKPAITATSKPGDFSGHGLARGQDLRRGEPGGPGQPHEHGRPGGQTSTEGEPTGPGQPHGPRGSGGSEGPGGSSHASMERGSNKPIGYGGPGQPRGHGGPVGPDGPQGPGWPGQTAHQQGGVPHPHGGPPPKPKEHKQQ